MHVCQRAFIREFYNQHTVRNKQRVTENKMVRTNLGKLKDFA